MPTYIQKVTDSDDTHKLVHMGNDIFLGYNSCQQVYKIVLFCVLMV